MKQLKEKISITLDPQILTEVRELAEENDRSLSQYINLVLKEHLKNRCRIGNERKNVMK